MLIFPTKILSLFNHICLSLSSESWRFVITDSSLSYGTKIQA